MFPALKIIVDVDILTALTDGASCGGDGEPEDLAQTRDPDEPLGLTAEAWVVGK